MNTVLFSQQFVVVMVDPTTGFPVKGNHAVFSNRAMADDFKRQMNNLGISRYTVIAKRKGLRFGRVLYV